MRNFDYRQGHHPTSVLNAALVLGLITALAWCASAWGKDTSISSDRSAANLTAFGPGLSWSREAPDGRHRLVSYTRVSSLLIQPPPADLGVRASSSPFDPDLGVDRRGQPAVVFTRCAGVSGRNCDVYGFDGKVESKVRGASSSRCSEFAPSIWKGIIAFARSGSRRCNGLYLKGRGAALRLDSRVPADTDIRGNRIAYLHAPSARRTVIRLFSFSRQGGGSHIVIAGLRAEGERTRVTNPTFSGGYLYFLFEDLRRDDFLVGRSRGERQSVLEFSDRKLPGFVDSIGVDGRTVYYTNGRGVFQATGPAPKFSARD
jgi:hypothetical protein